MPDLLLRLLLLVRRLQVWPSIAVMVLRVRCGRRAQRDMDLTQSEALFDSTPRFRKFSFLRGV
jgi:hypothetical protein